MFGILKSFGSLTLAIGDDGNDIRMIQEANIGVGISGTEGSALEVWIFINFTSVPDCAVIVYNVYVCVVFVLSRLCKLHIVDVIKTKETLLKFCYVMVQFFQTID